MEIWVGIISSLSTTVLLGLTAYLAKNWLLERLKTSLQKEHSKFLEELQWETKVREQAEKVAEYLALARQLNEKSTKEEFVKANQLSWQLAMWLPEDVYKETVSAIANPNVDTNELSAVIRVRSLLLKDKAGNLTQDSVAHHAPGIGARSN
ncbi:hypothetical protein [Vibrio harveyi]|uniref:hypothetical protein n=1 Tax=Vibrio harveyi TaxID=669 RepID=UPI000D7829B3|nr:hypothetical protein [Vibrio harveyi]HDM8059293.1 hypothetical protein [Vibrio harveyi]